MSDDAEAVRRAAQKAKQSDARKRQAEGHLTKREVKRRRAEGTVLTKPRLTKDARRSAHAAQMAAPAARLAMGAEANVQGGATSWREREYAGKGRNEFRKKREADEELAAEAKGRRAHDVVIVPIFWRNHEGEEEAVCAEADRIKKLLVGAQARPLLDVWVDRTHKKNPGQKLQFWEVVGVKWRIELGPRDVRAKTCVVSRASSDGGGFAGAKKLSDVSSTKRHELLAALRDDLGLAKIPAEMEQDADGDAFNAREADANVAAWDAAAAPGQGPASAAPWGAPRAPPRGATRVKIKIDPTKASASKRSFNDDEQDDDQFAAADDDDGDDDDDA